MVFQDELVTVSVRTPNFRNRPKSTLPINPYTKYSRIETDPIGRLVYSPTFITGPDAGKTLPTYYFMNSKTARFAKAVPSWGGSDVSGRVTNELLNKLSTTVSNLSVTLGEAPKTAAMVAQSATKIYWAIKALRRFDLADFSKALGISRSVSLELRFGRRKKIVSDQLWDLEHDSKIKFGKRTITYGDQRILKVHRSSPQVQDFLANTWLEYSYGWKPLLSDVYDQAKALATHMVERSNVVRQASCKLSEAERYIDLYNPSDNPCWTLESKREESHHVFAKVWYSIPEAQINAVNTFGLNNPLVLAWELLPFSFVADWFLPVGNFLEKLTATNGLEFHRGVRTTKVVKTVTKHFYGNGVVQVTSGSLNSASGSVTETVQERSFTREVLGGFPTPNWPQFRSPASFGHALTSIALVQSLFLRK